MLKPLIKIVKTCIVCLTVCVLFSVIFEFIEFPHSHFIQELFIGSACSFIVVIISTIAQYKVEFKKAYNDYISTTSDLIFTLSLFADGQDAIQGKRAERIFVKLDTDFEKFRKAEMNVIYLTKRKTEKHIKRNANLNKLNLIFLKKQFDSHEDAICAATGKDEIIRAIESCLKNWPECYEKNHIAMVKEWLVKETDEEVTHDQL